MYAISNCDHTSPPIALPIAIPRRGYSINCPVRCPRIGKPPQRKIAGIKTRQLTIASEHERFQVLVISSFDSEENSGMLFMDKKIFIFYSC